MVKFLLTYRHLLQRLSVWNYRALQGAILRKPKMPQINCKFPYPTYVLCIAEVWYERVLLSIIWTYTGCSLCRLIRRPELLIGRHWYLPANWKSFIRWYLISESVSVIPPSVIEASILRCSIWVNVQSACALNTRYIPTDLKLKFAYTNYVTKSRC
jgi:hypothetical protein